MSPPPTAPQLADRLRSLVVDTLEDLIARHLPGLRIPGTFAGRKVDPEVAADLVFTLGWLDAAGVASIAGWRIEEAVSLVLAGIDGAETHTFFSYRVAEMLARWGPFGDNPLMAGWDAAARANVAEACDSSSWIPLLDQGLPRNYAAVLARGEVARQALGLEVDPDVVGALVARAHDVLAANPHGYLDDSTHHIGRYDIYSADVWLFTEPLADHLGPIWNAGLQTALGLVERVATPDGTAVAWGRSTGVLGGALTVELAALALAGHHTDQPDRWLRRAGDAADAIAGWFTDGLVNAHQHRSPYDYRGPFRRLQLTLDILGKLAWSCVQLAQVDPTLVAASHRDTYPWHDELISFDDDRAAAVWAHRSPGTELVVPFVGATRSDYLAAPRHPGLFEVPVDTDIPCWVPLVAANHRLWTAGGVPDEVVAGDDGVSATWRGLVRVGDLDPEADRRRLPGRCDARWQIDGRTVRFDLDLELQDRPDAITVVIPETKGRPLHVEVLEHVGPGEAHLDTIDVDGIKEWRSFWATLPVVHQVDLDPATEQRVSLRVTPVLRVASTAHGHHYDTSLYAPLAARVRGLPSPIGAFADRHVRLDDLDLFHLHWPEWLAFDDVDEHRRLIERLSAARVPIVWTAHNLTPHEKQPERYDPIYQLWAGAAAGVIHHSAWGERRMRDRYQFTPDARHAVVPHGHFGGLYRDAARLDRHALETELGLAPAPVRIGLLGAPRSEKLVDAFLDGVIASARDDIQVVCWSLRPDQIAPHDPRIAVAESYEMVDVTTYGHRLAACDLVALPFDPAGDMLATGVAADVIGLGLGAMVSDWGYLSEALGEAGIACGHTAASVAAALDALTGEQIAAARAASVARQAELSWDVVAERTVELFEAVVHDAAARRDD